MKRQAMWVLGCWMVVGPTAAMAGGAACAAAMQKAREGRPTGEELKAAADLVMEIEAKPGFFSQMCSMARLEAGRFSPFAFQRFEHRISAENFTRLRARRDAVVAVLAEDLRAAAKGKKVAEELRFEESGPFGLNRLCMLIDLNGVEALDALCDVAAHGDLYVKGAANSPGRQQFRVQYIDPDEIAFLKPPEAGQLKGSKADKVKKAPKIETVDASTVPEFHTACVLSTITAILRQERYGPVLESDLEAEYCKAGQADAARYPSKKEPAPENKWDIMDPLCKVRMGAQPYCFVELTPQRREQIIGWAREYLKTTPAEKRKGAAGMAEHPIIR